MLLPQPHRIGFNQRLMPVNFAVLIAEQPAWKRSESGSIAELLCLQKIIAASGRSFTNARVAVLGGHGVAIVPPQNSASKTLQTLKVRQINPLLNPSPHAPISASGTHSSEI